VEEVNKLVLQGVPFRDAYKKIGLDIEKGEFSPDKTVEHTHEGSIGNLCNDEIKLLKQQIVTQFNFHTIEEAERKLLSLF
jgi:argininosuccinate lyase